MCIVSSPCIGWTVVEFLSASFLGTLLNSCRMIIPSAPIADSVSKVSPRVSPFLVELFVGSRWTTVAPSLFPAISNELLVLVEFSKNSVIRSLFCRSGGGSCLLKALASLIIFANWIITQSSVSTRCGISSSSLLQFLPL